MHSKFVFIVVHFHFIYRRFNRVVFLFSRKCGCFFSRISLSQSWFNPITCNSEIQPFKEYDVRLSIDSLTISSRIQHSSSTEIASMISNLLLIIAIWFQTFYQIFVESKGNEIYLRLLRFRTLSYPACVISVFVFSFYSYE